MAFKRSGRASSSNLTITDKNTKISALVVDDSATIRLLHKGLCNMEPTIARNGKETATRQLREMGVKSKIVGVTMTMKRGNLWLLEKPLNRAVVEGVMEELSLM
ncbi:hypothetical protein RJT34_29859 [Clitoria ternatea]|uniref:Response regulatory domain-containing protein n=1 Tax=Clitoria ternatea TaxID=43366 RepID=A0AAN9EYZ4_CLITE